MDDSDFLVAVVLITFVLFKKEQDLVFSVKLHFKKKLVKEGFFPKMFWHKTRLRSKVFSLESLWFKRFWFGWFTPKTKLDLFGQKNLGLKIF